MAAKHSQNHPWWYKTALFSYLLMAALNNKRKVIHRFLT
jgi:hypothetical protein